MSPSSSKTDKYGEKRDLDSSPEPGAKKSRTRSGRSFVIQTHDDSNLHYDFRLEIDGALESWAIPKGPSTDPSEKRLAIPTEPHPPEYAEFEGVIPEEEYVGVTSPHSGTGHCLDFGTRGGAAYQL